MEIRYLHGIDAATESFLAEWYDARDYITAHTSGSTGKPKEIRLLKEDMRVSARATCRRFGIDCHKRLLMPLSTAYIAGKMMIVRALESGAELTVAKPTRDLSALAAISSTIALLPIVPSQIDALLRLPNAALFENIIVGGAPLTPNQEAAVKTSGLNVYATYGMTETCSHVALRRVGYEEAFTAMPGISFGVDSDSCLVINAHGYSQGCFRTNDVVRLIDAFHFVWCGRRDNVINSGGVKIMPEEVEIRLRPYLGDADFYITSRRSEEWGEELVMVVATHGNDTDYTVALAQARAVIPHHLLPKSIITVPEHTYTSTGKLIRKKFD